MASRFSRNNKNSLLRIPRFVLSFGLIVTASANAAVQLDKLTQCADIQRLYETIKQSHPRFGNCRPARGTVERGIQRLLPTGHEDEICFWDDTPATFLAGFSCFSYKNAENGLLCVRQTSSSDLLEYKDNYKERYAAVSKAYTHAAEQCAVSNGDASESLETLMPAPLSSVAKYSFGFIMGLGSMIPANSAIHHGFGTVYEGEFDNKVQAVEFVSIYFATSPPDANARESNWKAAGKWRVNIDDGSEIQEMYAKEFRRNNVLGFVDFTDFDIETALTTTFDDGAKSKQQEGWQDVLAQALGTHGFTELTEDDLDGMSFADLLREKIESGALGKHNDIVGRLSEKGILLAARRTPHCVRNGGTMIALVMALKPRPGFRKDFGSVIFGIIGVSSCGRRHGSAGDFLDATVQDAKTALLNALESGE